MRTVVFASKDVGNGVYSYLTQQHPEDLVGLVCLDTEFEIFGANAADVGHVTMRWSEVENNPSIIEALRPDLIVLAWWPHIVADALVLKARLGAVNLHNSLLPHGRGVAANYWAIRDSEPYGVSIHRVTNRIDAGNIVAQAGIEVDWTDTGESLYWRGIARLIELFIEIYPAIEQRILDAHPQDLSLGSIHSWREMNGSEDIDLDDVASARDILNRIRAKTFAGHPMPGFVSDGVRYEIRLQIVKSDEA